MKVIIAGSRDINMSIKKLQEVIDESGFTITEVVSGGSGMIDKLGEEWGLSNCVPVSRFTAAWQTYGASAGPRRNKQMAEYADALIAVWDDQSRGTKNMIDLARQRSLKIFVYHV